MIIRDTDLQNTSEPAIAYSECYRLPFLSLFHADCMDIMKDIETGAIDLIVTDPPLRIDELKNQHENTIYKLYELLLKDSEIKKPFIILTV